MHSSIRNSWARQRLGGLSRQQGGAYGAIAVYAAVNLVILLALRPAPNTDWAGTWWWVATWVGDGELYAHTWRYSPLALPIMTSLIQAGPLALITLHVIAIGLVARLGRVVFYAVAFSAFVWVDIVVGNTFTFVVVAAAFALSGSRLGALGFLALTALMPRPVQLPLAMWLLWARPDVRMPFVAIAVASFAASAAMGFLGPWAAALAGSTSETGAAYALGPAAIIGDWWPVLGLPLAALLVRRGWPAVGGLALSPYLLPQYLALGIPEVARWLEGRVRLRGPAKGELVPVPMQREVAPFQVGEPGGAPMRLDPAMPAEAPEALSVR